MMTAETVASQGSALTLENELTKQNEVTVLPSVLFLLKDIILLTSMLFDRML